MPPTAGSSTASGDARSPAFWFDLASPDAYLVAEQILHVAPEPCEWVPVLQADLPGGAPHDGFRCAEEEDVWRGHVERRAAAAGLQPVRWPEPFPFDSAFAQRAATFAKGTGRTVAFALAAFRQAYAGGRSLADPDHVLIAAAACELHPRAVLAGADSRATDQALREATAGAAERGVRCTPAVWTGERVVHGTDALDPGVWPGALRYRS